MREWRIEDLTINVESVLRGQGADPEIMKVRSPRLVSLAEKALDESINLLKPAVLYKKLQVQKVRHDQLFLENGIKITGDIVSQHLVSVEAIIAVICTIGRDIEDYASNISENNMTFALAVDGVGSAGVEALANAVCNYFEQESLKKGLNTTIPLSPGMVGWPVENGQKILFEILRPEKIGIELTPLFMMIPRKTISLLIGIGKEMNSSKNPCDYCAMNVTCRYKDQYGHRNKINE